MADRGVMVLTSDERDRYRASLDECVEWHHATKVRKMVTAPMRPARAKLAAAAYKMLGGHVVEATARTFWGREMLVALPELVSCQIYSYGYFEADVAAFMLIAVKESMCVFDVGAHFGFFTLLAADLVGSGGEVHAFEPTPRTFAWLARNVSELPHVEVNRRAVWSRQTGLMFRDYGLVKAAFNSHFGARDGSVDSRQSEFSVRATTLEAYSQAMNRLPDFIKIDAESAELEVLHGLGERILRHQPLIALEVGDVAGLADVQPSRQAVEYLISHGYKCYECKSGHFRSHVPAEQYSYGNLFFVPISSRVVDELTDR